MRNILYLSCITLLLSSCLTNKKLAYFQSDRFSEVNPTLIENAKFEYRIQPSDVLSIRVMNVDPEAASFFNNEAGGPGGINPAANLYVNGFSVDDKGYINYPAIGNIQVINMTVPEIQNLIQLKVDEYLKNATVIVKLISFKFTILGEVRSPGYYYVYNNQATVPEALGMAGDLTNNGNRKNIKLVRQTLQGSEVVLLDLTDPKLIQSKYYFLLPNDMIYVEPLRAQLTRTNLGILPFFFSAISTTLAIFLAYDRITNPR
jgi:polysaccharide biosynthesis/export protein